MSEVVTAISSAVAIIGIAISGISLYISISKASKEDAKVQDDKTKELEHRLTVLETTQFKAEDRKCLEENNVKINALWGMIMKDFPDLLKHERTPVYDALLNKAKMSWIMNGDIKNLSSEERRQLSSLLDDEYLEAVKSKNRDLASAIAVYRTVFKYENGEGVNVACKP